MRKAKKFEKFAKLAKVFNEDTKNSECLNFVTNFMPLAISKYYVEIIFPDNIKSETMNMVENIRNSMINRIQKLEWLDESTRKFAIEKVLAIKYILGYPDIIMDVEKIYNEYKLLEYVSENPLSIALSIIIFGLKEEYNSLFVKDINDIIKSYEFIPPYEVNAYYSAKDNTMNFPASILQSPYFDVNQPDYLNYGGVGSVMGHELTHAFDDNGKNYDAIGQKVNWWTDNDNDEFTEFSQCFIDQYNEYTFEFEGKKYNVNGKHTLGENLADSGGLDRAYEAWKNSLENQPERAQERNMLLPGLSDYSMEQLFFIAYGHTRCEVGISKLLIEDVHSPGRYRVNGVVSNNERFAKAFNCPVKSKLNPEQKCGLW